MEKPATKAKWNAWFRHMESLCDMPCINKSCYISAVLCKEVDKGDWVVIKGGKLLIKTKDKREAMEYLEKNNLGMVFFKRVGYEDDEYAIG